VSTYEIVMADIKALARYNWKYIVVDEGHRLKNFNCKLIRDLKTLPVDNKLLLTGERLGGDRVAVQPAGVCATKHAFQRHPWGLGSLHALTHHCRVCRPTPPSRRHPAAEQPE
jgi:hypothetical protein